MEAGARISIEAEVSPVQQIGTVLRAARAAAAALVQLLRPARGDRISISEDCTNAESALATQQIALRLRAGGAGGAREREGRANSEPPPLKTPFIV